MSEPTPDAGVENLSTAEELDEDQLQVDPLERGVEPPERTLGVDRVGVTEAEQRTGETLDERLAQEQPDVAPNPQTRRDGPAPDGLRGDVAGGSVADALREEPPTGRD